MVKSKLLNSNKVYINYSNNYYYPKASFSFNPSYDYPEYIFHGEVAPAFNPIYDMVRESFNAMGYDKAHFQKSEWNPLGHLIAEDDTVLIKSNMVMHNNEIEENGTDCLVTNPAVIRPVIDYVLIALNGTGKVFIGDAPMQSCDFDILVNKMGYDRLIQFYNARSINVELVDFRNYISRESNGMLIGYKPKTLNETVIVNLETDSSFSSISNKRFHDLRITNYKPDIMYEHHNERKNEYSIAKKVLEADVIINMPKPKTHRKAGVTIALKNLVGIVTNKEWLPHHTIGSLEEGGDEYLHKSFVKKKLAHALDKKNSYSGEGKYHISKLWTAYIKGLQVMKQLYIKDKYFEGSWYGNDTIWRTILDLNKILLYADSQGKLHDEPQRKILIIGDLIISGEGEGPLLPSPKDVGIIAIGENPVCFDEAVSTLMGFDFTKIPTIKHAREIKDKYILCPFKQTIVYSNNSKYNSKSPENLKYDEVFHYIPPSGWANGNVLKRR